MRRGLDADFTQVGWIRTQLNWSCCYWPLRVAMDGFRWEQEGLTYLPEAGADIRAKNKDSRIAKEIAAEYRNEVVWDSGVEELGFIHDGTRMRRPLSEVRGCPGAFESPGACQALATSKPRKVADVMCPSPA
jgi:hypothetical protein